MIVNPFPVLLNFELFAPLILRLFLGFVIIYLGNQTLTNLKTPLSEFFERCGLKPGDIFVSILGVIEFTIAILLTVGLYTQIGALLSILIILGLMSVRKKYPAISPFGTILCWSIITISLSLMLTGAGAYSIDLPL